MKELQAKKNSLTKELNNLKKEMRSSERPLNIKKLDDLEYQMERVEEELYKINNLIWKEEDRRKDLVSYKETQRDFGLINP